MFLRRISANSESLKIPDREECLAGLKSGKEYDILVIGGGSTGAGAGNYNIYFLLTEANCELLS